MYGILAIIGFICLLWFLSKLFTKLGNWLSNFSSEVSDYAAVLRKKSRDEDRIRRQNIKISEQTQSSIKGVEDVIYHDKVIKEIKELTGEL